MVKRRGDKHWYRVRWEVLLRDQFTCQYCGRYAPDVRLEVDHKVPRSENGGDDITNLVTACYSCNRGKEGYRAFVTRKTMRSAAGNSIPSGQSRAITYWLEHPQASTDEVAMAIGTTAPMVRVYKQRAKKRGLLRQE